MSDQPDLRKRLENAPLPDEKGAEERSWRLIQAAYAVRSSSDPRARWPRFAAVTAVGIAALTLTFSPAGAKVGDWIEEVLAPSSENAAPVLRSVPGGGELLVESREGAWLVNSDGSKRLLGSYSDVTWSPRGLFVAGADGQLLVATEPSGDIRWSVTAPGRVSDPAWSPSGFRIAYRSGDTLRAVAGDGVGDRLVADSAGPAHPAWRPLSANEFARDPSGVGTHSLAYADRHGRVVVRDVDSGRLLWAHATRGQVIALSWSADGRYLAVALRDGIRILNRDGRAVPFASPIDPATRVTDLAASPSANRFAAVTHQSDGARGARSEVLVLGSGRSPRSRTVFTGPGRISGITFSPDGGRLLLEWRDADQWLFLPMEGKDVRRPSAIEGIARQFEPGAVGASEFPRLEGWCCAVRR